MNLFNSRICTFKEKINGPGGRFTKIKYAEYNTERQGDESKKVEYKNFNISLRRFPAEEIIGVEGNGKEIMTDIVLEVNMEKFTFHDTEHTINYIFKNLYSCRGIQIDYEAKYKTLK